MISQLAFKNVNGRAQLNRTWQAVPNCYCAVQETSLSRSSFVTRDIQIICVAGRAAAYRSPRSKMFGLGN